MYARTTQHAPWNPFPDTCISSAVRSSCVRWHNFIKYICIINQPPACVWVDTTTMMTMRMRAGGPVACTQTRNEAHCRQGANQLHLRADSFRICRLEWKEAVMVIKPESSCYSLRLLGTDEGWCDNVWLLVRALCRRIEPTERVIVHCTMRVDIRRRLQRKRRRQRRCDATCDVMRCDAT